MNQRAFIVSLCFTITICIIAYAYYALPKETKVVFCDVGQGDGIYIRVKNKTDILVDAGRGNKILECLGDHMPFYDRDIELVLLTHADQDHIGGFVDITTHYVIDAVIVPHIPKDTKTYGEMLRVISEKDIPTHYLWQGDVVKLEQANMHIVWPPRTVTKSAEDTNKTSYIALFSENSYDILLTGDAHAETIEELLPHFKNISIEVFKLPHHGASNGFSLESITALEPQLSIISVGTNSYNHPSPEVIETLDNGGWLYQRTDEKGDIVINIPSKTK